MKDKFQKIFNKKENLISFAIVVLTSLALVLGCVKEYKETGEIDVNKIGQAVDMVVDELNKYEMTEEEIKELPSTEIVEKTIKDEQSQEQTVENEAFKLQGEIAYNGALPEKWDIALGNYVGLTYFSQLDSRWSSKMYSSVNDVNQTIGSSGCGPTSASMIVTAIKGTVTPDIMADNFVRYGYRSANQGTYWSAFRAVADEFDIEYKETTDINKAIELLADNHYVVASCGNGLFTTGGHFIVLTKLENNMIEVYDPYLYSGKFNISTRRGKAEVQGNKVYVSVDNFKAYANAKGFFCYKHEAEVKENNTKQVVTQSYTRYVKVNTSLNVRNAPSGTIVGSLKNGQQVTVYETNESWSRIDTNKWVCNTYLSESIISNSAVTSTIGSVKKLTKASILYSNSNLTGTQYNYKANTTITILQNISANIDRVRVNATGRIAYINNSNYSNVTISTARGTVGKTKKTNACYLYSNSNLTGTKYTYKANTTVTILQNVNSYIDRVKVNATGRIAYINVNNYR